jgi:serine/threonine protein kinase
MNPDQWKRLQQIFDGALAQPIDSRRAWVRQACGDDRGLLLEAEAILDAHESPDSGFLEQPARVDPADLDALPPGTELGSYRILREIGRGGMGIVYQAQDNLGRSVAIKTLPPILAADVRLRERLAREARAAATIEHVGVATVYVFGEIDGHLVIVSEYVPGETLRTLISSGPIEPARAHSIATQIAGALAAAHEAGVVHRDLKPENVVITPGGLAKVVDFGIARFQQPEPSRLMASSTGVGTPGYMAPEQHAGGTVTPGTDVYAFGIVFSEMLTGRHPLDRSPRATIPPRVAAIIAKCVSADPAARYASGRELLAALAADGSAAAAPNGRDATNVGSPRWWWEFHQAVTAAVYGLMIWPAWNGRTIVGGRIGEALFLATLIAVIVAAILRLHLWFTSRFYRPELRWARRRAAKWVRAADWLFVGSLAATGILIGDDQPVAIVLVAVAVGAAIAFLIIERATARAAFRNSVTPARHP